MLFVFLLGSPGPEQQQQQILTVEPPPFFQALYSQGSDR